jgi:hypothetical protein
VIQECDFLREEHIATARPNPAAPDQAEFGERLLSSQGECGMLVTMSPGGHLVTTAVACAATGLRTDSAPLTAGIALGGFCIDVDHAVDYVVFDGQTDLRPGAFLRYYLEGRAARGVRAGLRSRGGGLARD